ncbi:hypothetical protein CspHIS471_0302240 [Cutaneotrichosporon sp. HIS471]|nr:hypothetical protein CspHIS471_0302240 [Cutaneotrichosporon sp. HIS471]
MAPKLGHDLASSHVFADATATFAAFAAGADLDPSLLALSGASASTPIDPQLFAIESVVHDVQRGRVEDLERDLAAEVEAHEAADEVHPDSLLGDDEGHDDHIAIDDDGIDPALREIVNSLTNAQQSHHPIGDEERERLDRERLQHTLQTTLEDFTQHGLMNSYNALFNSNFPQSPSSLVLPLDEPEVPVKRGRGRPKGSKNKPKPGAPPPPPPPPKRKRGRPPKIRTSEELEEMEQRRQEKELGIQRKRGRPRKYPEIGLVREMRLKKNRAMFAKKVKELEEQQQEESNEYETQDHHQYDSPIDVALGEQVAAAVARQPVQDGEYWSYQDGQSLLDVVGSSLGVEGSSGVGGIGVDVMSGDQSDEMRGVFTLPDVPEVQQ